MLKKIIAYLPSTVIPILVNFVLVFIYAGEMSPDEYGIYNVYLNTISILYAVALSFLQSASFRFYSMKDVYSCLEEFYSTYYVANLVIGAALAAVLLAANIFFGYDWVVVSFAVAVNAFYQFQLNMQRLKNSTAGYTAARLSASFGALAFIALAVVALDEIGYSIPIYTFYGAYLFTVIAGLAKDFRFISPKHFSKDLLMKSLKFGLPMMGVTVIGLLISYSAQYVILHYLDEAAVGYYSLGFRLSDTVISNITMIILIVMTPTVMRLYDQGEDGASDGAPALLTQLLNLDLWVVLPCCALIAFYSGDIIRLIFPSYEGAEAVVVIVVLSAVLRSVSMIACKGLELACQTGKMFLFLCIALIVNLVYSLAFVPVYGLVAAGHASVLAYLAYDTLLVVSSKGFVPVRFDVRYVLKALLAMAITSIVAYAMSLLFGVVSIASLLLQGCADVVIYLAVSLALGLHRAYLSRR